MTANLLSNVLNAGRIFLLGADVSPMDGCEFIISLSKDDDLLLVEREIRGEFQSPRPNSEMRGEFQSPRLQPFVDTNKTVEPIPYFTQDIIENDHPKIICPNPLRSETKRSIPKPNVNTLTVNTSIANMYHDAILTDVYDDNSYE
jgi:hypothetical protein